MIDGLSQEQKMRVALQQVLLFFGNGHWDDSKRSQWAVNCATLLRIPPQDFGATYDPNYSFDATTKVLCDCVRASLRTDQENYLQKHGEESGQ